MKISRILIPAALAAATFAGCFAYLVTPPATLRDMTAVGPAPILRAQVEIAGGSNSTYLGGDEKAAAAYWDAAQAILRRAPNARASIDKSSSDAIPLPKSRPLPRFEQ
jgi:hypothetical protein